MKKTVISLIFPLLFLFSGCCAEPQPLQVPSLSYRDQALTLLVKVDQQVQSLCLQDYLAGVLLAEMPTDFAPEALKAQAIAARTFALRKADTARHPDAHVCSQSSCCQGWESITTCPPEIAQKLLQAVQETDGLVLTYEDRLIDATFFSCSGGRTEAAAAVWGSDVPYLQAVDSPGEEAAPVYEEERSWSAEELRQLLQEALPTAQLQGSPDSWFTELCYTPGGGILSLKLGGISLKGTELRKLLSLRSTRISIYASEGEIRIRSYGYGHRVGLSQYGAEAMAQEGKSCREILLHYYPNTTLYRLQPTGQ